MSFVLFRNVFIRFVNEKALAIQWELEPTPQDLRKVLFTVWQSDNQESGFEQVSPPLLDTCTYLDLFEGYRPSKFHVRFYKVKAVRQTPGGEEATESHVEYLHENPFDDTRSPYQDPVLDMVRRNNLMLSHPRYRVGKPCVVYQKRLHGSQCSCFDPITQRVTKSQCSDCLGTGKLEGYHTGIDGVFVHFSVLVKAKMIQQWGEVSPGDTSGWMSNYPLVNPEDIIINKLSNEYWLVKQVQQSHHLITVKQTLLLRKLNFDDIKLRLSFTNTDFRM